MQQAWQSTESKAEYLRRALIEQNVPARDALEQGRARLNALSSLKVEAADAQKRCDDAEAALSDFDAKPVERPALTITLYNSKRRAIAALYICPRIAQPCRSGRVHRLRPLRWLHFLS